MFYAQSTSTLISGRRERDFSLRRQRFQLLSERKMFQSYGVNLREGGREGEREREIAVRHRGRQRLRE